MKVGDTVWMLCAKVDPAAVTYGDSAPAIDSHTLEWAPMIVLSVSEEDVEVQFPDKSTTNYERRFLLTAAERGALVLPRTVEENAAARQVPGSVAWLRYVAENAEIIYVRAQKDGHWDNFALSELSEAEQADIVKRWIAEGVPNG